MLVGFHDFIASRKPALQFDVCIAGGGVAGITLALELARSDMRVLLLEGGDIDFTAESQELYAGKNIGRDYFDLDVGRLRFLGGSSNHWAGFCVPFDDLDFMARPEIAASGWPIAKADLSPFLAQAADILEIDNLFRSHELAGEASSRLRRFETQMSPPVRFGEKYAGELRASEHVCAVLNASVTDIGIDTASGRVTRFEVTHTHDPDQKVIVRADRFVLAMGGIENARSLLNANDQIEHGIGNHHDLVGRYFMDHIQSDLGFALLSDPLSDLFDDVKTETRMRDAVSFAPTREFQRAAGILNCELRVKAIEGRMARSKGPLKSRLKRMICSNDLALSAVRSLDADFKQEKCWLAHRIEALPDDGSNAVVMTRSEQAPNYNSRVMLSDDRDRLGMRRATVDWQLLDVDKATLKRCMLELGRYFAETDIGRIRVADWLLDEGAGVAGMAEGERGAHGGHHIGTTRMAARPGEGVVDRHCKVFGTQNLYVAGSSVFPTGGHAPPTLTIVQLTLRLAKHLASAA